MSQNCHITNEREIFNFVITFKIKTRFDFEYVVCQLKRTVEAFIQFSLMKLYIKEFDFNIECEYKF